MNGAGGKIAGVTICSSREGMAPSVLIKGIVEALEMPMEEFPSFVDLDTGQVETISLDLLREAEEPEEDEPDDPEAEEDDELELAKRIVFSGRFRRLPTQFDIHEWSIMEEFSNSVGSNRLREELLDAIHGRGAFRVFKDTIRRLRIEKDWYAFREQALREIAMEWCEEHKLEWK